MKGWGLAMQDDITDAANWMVEKTLSKTTCALWR